MVGSRSHVDFLAEADADLEGRDDILIEETRTSTLYAARNDPAVGSTKGDPESGSSRCGGIANAYANFAAALRLTDESDLTEGTARSQR